MTPWVLALAWGGLAAVPALRAARLRAVRVHAVGLSPSRSPSAGPGRSAHRRIGVPSWMAQIPRRWALRRATARERALLAAELPITVDLLAVAVGAGYTPHLAIEVAARWAPPVAAGLLGSVVTGCRLGADLDRALDDVAATHPELRGLVDALLATDRLGAPVLDALHRVAASARAGVRRRAETKARTVPVRLLFPLVFLVLPAFGLLTVVPAIAGGLAA